MDLSDRYGAFFNCSLGIGNRMLKCNDEHKQVALTSTSRQGKCMGLVSENWPPSNGLCKTTRSS